MRPGRTNGAILTRRRALLAGLLAPLLDGCGAPLPAMTASATNPAARAMLDASAAAHGMAALASVSDIAVRYAGQWHGIVGTLQPDLVDAGFRGRSEERLLLREALTAQAYTGPDGRKQVVRRDAPAARDVSVWFNGTETQDRDKKDAAALVADGYGLFLLGPMLLAGAWTASRAMVLDLADPQRIEVGGLTHDCAVLRARIAPGIGRAPADELAVFIDGGERLMRRVRFTLNGLDSTQGAVAEVDCWDHRTLRGVRWPTRFHERLLRPLPLPVHDWVLEGLDLNRGLTPGDVSGPAFGPLAAVPAAVLTAA